MTAIAAMFKALGDPIRLEMISRLSKGSDYTVGRLSEDLGISRQGARKHLQILADVRLVSFRYHGRQTEVGLERSSLAASRQFISELEAQWDQRLDDLRASIEDVKK
jgi:DNA-binding transcriptional ArsR family regulator